MNFLTSLGTALQSLGLALMIGGMLALGAFVAPVLFKQLARPEAGTVMTIMFRRYDTVLMIATGMVIVGEVLRHLQNGFPDLTPMIITRFALIVILAAGMAYSLFVINPKIEEMQVQGHIHDSVEDKLAFNKIHKTSENIYKFELLVAIALLMMTPFMASPTLKP